jgi:hypothetical protein
MTYPAPRRHYRHVHDALSASLRVCQIVLGLNFVWRDQHRTSLYSSITVRDFNPRHEFKRV